MLAGAVIFATLKSLGSIIGNAPAAMSKFIELSGQVHDLITENHRLIDENRTLKDEARSLAEKLKVRGSMVKRENRYFVVEDGKPDDGPYCALCWQDAEKAISMVPCSDGGGVGFRCIKCKYVLYDGPPDQPAYHGSSPRAFPR